MRVLQLVFSLDVGGLEQVVVDLCNHLPNDGIQCFLCCLSHAGAKAALVKEQACFIGGLSVNQRFPDKRILSSLYQVIINNKIELIHSHNPKAHLYGSILSLLTGLPHVQTVHGRGSANETLRRKWLRRTLTKFTDKMVAVSDDVKVKLIDIDGIQAEKITTIINGVDTECYQPASTTQERQELRRQLRIPEKAFVIGSVGRFAQEKNYTLMIEAFSVFNSSYPSSHLVIVGDGSEMQAVISSIQKFGVQQYCSLPGIRDDISDWMKSFDVFSLSSITEGTSVTLLEALATGIPIVATDAGGNRFVVNPPECGLIVSNNNASALCQAWDQIASNRDLYQQMSLAGRKRCTREFSVQAMVRQYNLLFTELTS